MKADLNRKKSWRIQHYSHKSWYLHREVKSKDFLENTVGIIQKFVFVKGIKEMLD